MVCNFISSNLKSVCGIKNLHSSETDFTYICRLGYQLCHHIQVKRKWWQIRSEALKKHRENMNGTGGGAGKPLTDSEQKALDSLQSRNSELIDGVDGGYEVGALTGMEVIFHK